MNTFKILYKSKFDEEDYGELIVAASNKSNAKKYVIWLYSMYNYILDVFPTNEDANIFVYPEDLKRIKVN